MGVGGGVRTPGAGGVGGGRGRSRGPDRFRAPRPELVERAARALEEAGKAAYIPGEGGDDAGIKFF